MRPFVFLVAGLLVISPLSLCLCTQCEFHGTAPQESSESCGGCGGETSNEKPEECPCACDQAKADMTADIPACIDMALGGFGIAEVDLETALPETTAAHVTTGLDPPRTSHLPTQTWSLTLLL